MTVAVTSQRYAGPKRANSPSILSGCGSLITDAGLQLYHHAGLDFATLLLDGDANRQALGDLGEVAARIWVGQQRELAGRSLPDARGRTTEAPPRQGIHSDRHGLSGPEKADVGILAELGSAAGRERVCEYVWISWAAVEL